MKKIATLIFATVMLNAAFAQYGSRDQYDKGYNKVADNNWNGGDKKFGRDDDHFKNGSFYLTQQRDMQIDQVNREYDLKVLSVRNRFFMGREKKERIIYMLENQRRQEIAQVYAKFSSLLYSRNDIDIRKHF